MSETATPAAQDTTKAVPGAIVPEATPATVPAADAKSAEPAKTVEANAKDTVVADASKTDPKAEVAPKVVPEKYDLKLPKDSKLDAASVEKIATFAKANSLSNEQAQSILDSENKAIASFEESQRNSLKQKADEWFEETKNDKEIGGAAFKENVELAKRVIDRFAPESLKKTLSDTGLGNHPDLVRTFLKIGKMMAEDKLVIPGTQSAAGSTDPAEILYGKK